MGFHGPVLTLCSHRPFFRRVKLYSPVLVQEGPVFLCRNGRFHGSQPRRLWSVVRSLMVPCLWPVLETVLWAILSIFGNPFVFQGLQTVSESTLSTVVSVHYSLGNGCSAALMELFYAFSWVRLPVPALFSAPPLGVKLCVPIF